ncbi:protein IQ-DOMAIN [Salix suchowensis]|nr:protein IQ-DOMAIN [Salix suchowensis]
MAFVTFNYFEMLIIKSKSKRKWSEKERNRDLAVSSYEETAAPSLSPPRTPPPPTVEDVKLTEAGNEQSKHAYSVALATAVAAEAAVAPPKLLLRLFGLRQCHITLGKSKEEIAAIKIQTAFRGYLARRALRALRGLVRLKSLIQGQSVKRQSTATLRAMQTLARVQSQIRARRIRMSEENEALQRQLQQKHDRELEKLRTSIGEQWDDSPQSKEQTEASLLHKQEAAMRRERALAYAYSHQQMWKQSSKSANATFMDPNNPHWGWSWLERWMAARPWESRSTIDNSDRASFKSATSRTMSLGEISRAYSRRDLNRDNKLSPVTGKAKPPSPRGSAWGGDEDSRSTFSVQSERYRRHSIAGSSIRDDESLASSPSIPSYMAPTRSQSAKSKSRLPSPLGIDNNGTPDKASVGSVKKRLSFSASPAGARRHSGPPRVDASIVKDIQMHTEVKLSNGASSK